MRVGVVADVHVGNHRRLGGPAVAGLNRRCRQAVDVLGRAAARAREAGCAALVVCGDLFDSARPEPQVIAAVMAALKCGPDRVLVLKGNHDSVSDAPGDHALGPLAEVEGFEVFDHPARVQFDREALLLVPFRSGAASGWLEEVVAREAQGAETMFLHLGVSDAGTPPWLAAAPDSIRVEELQRIMQLHGVRRAYAGNWHGNRSWGWSGSSVARVTQVGALCVTQVGALCPTGFDDAGYNYGALVISAGTWDNDNWIRGPRFVTIDVSRLGEFVSRGVPEEVEGAVRDGCRVYVRVRHGLADAAAAATLLEELRCAGIEDGELELVGGEAEQAARAAAEAVRGAATLGEALAAYVAEMQLPEGVDRAGVLERARGYLLAGGGP